jgi:hypothetical protein
VGEQQDLKTRIADEIKQALKAGEKVRLGTLRMLAAAVKNREVELGHELDDEEVRQVAVREIKRRNESIEAFARAGRDELVAKETAEREVLEAYAPRQLGPDEVEALIGEAIAATRASSAADLGKVMGFVMGRAKGRVDGAAVQARVRELLGG